MAQAPRLTDAQIEFYRQNGYVVVEGVLDDALLAELRRMTEHIVEQARGLTADDALYDLEDSHSPDQPRVRRLKTPHKHFPFFWDLARHPRVTGVLAQLLGPDIRLHGTKMNMKSAGFGAPVEWHQDWAFYPHTNDDILATGLLLDDADEHNGPLMVLPGSHRGPTHDHHHEGRFCGAIDIGRAGLDCSGAVKLLGPAGSMTIHHVRAVHGSALNTSNRPRRLLLHEYAAADAWPLAGQPWSDLEEFNGRMVAGTPTIQPRVVPAPIRIPQPPALNPTSIYNVQKGIRMRSFSALGETAPAES